MNEPESRRTERGGHQRDERRHQRAEDQQEQDDDEEVRGILDLPALPGGLGVRRRVRGQLPRQVRLQAGRERRAGDGAVHVVDQGVALALVERGRRGDQEELGRLPVGRGAEILDRERGRDLAQVGQERAEGRLVGRVQRAAVGEGDHGHGALRHRPDQRLCEQGGLVARCALGQEGAVVVVDLTGQ